MRRTLEISSLEMMAEPQKVQGPRPCFRQMTLPQARQLGAMSRSGWRVPMQLQFLFLVSAGESEASEGLVWISRERMAESRSESAVEAPCIAVPPVSLILVFRDGLAFLDDEAEPFLGGGARASEISCPAAEGGAVGACCFVVEDPGSVIRGICFASGFPRSARLSATCCLWLGRAAFGA
jgi:hypothetical protein